MSGDFYFVAVSSFNFSIFVVVGQISKYLIYLLLVLFAFSIEHCIIMIYIIIIITILLCLISNCMYTCVLVNEAYNWQFLFNCQMLNMFCYII